MSQPTALSNKARIPHTGSIEGHTKQGYKYHSGRAMCAPFLLSPSNRQASPFRHGCVGLGGLSLRLQRAARELERLGSTGLQIDSRFQPKVTAECWLTTLK